MPDVTLLHCADLHLDSKLLGLERYEGAPVEELRGASRRALENMVRTAIDEGVGLVLIAGDVFDGDWKDYNTGLFFSRQMAHLRDAGIPVVMIAGNHDAESQLTKKIRYPDNVHLLPNSRPDSKLFADLGIVVHGQGFATREVVDDLSAAYPSPLKGLVNVGLLHTCADGRDGHDNYAPCDPRRLPARGYDYWALGHVHRRETLLNRPDHGCWAVFPGNLQGRHAREVGEKGFCLVRIEDGEAQAPEHHACDVVRWTECRVDASAAEDSEAALHLIHLALRGAQESADGRLLAARVTLTGRSRARTEIERSREAFVTEVRNLANQLGGEGVWVEKVRIDLRSAHDMAELGAKDEPIGDLLRHLNDASDSLVSTLVEELRPLLAALPGDVQESLGSVSPAELLRRLSPEVAELMASKVLD